MLRLIQGRVPSKDTDDIDLTGPLRQFVRSNYGAAEQYAGECSTIHRLRQDMRGAGKDENGRDLLYRYYGQLELLELRFPIDEEHVRIIFTWYDAFTQSPISQYSLAYEKACVLFNIASILSFTAITQSRSESDGMKKAYHSFQAAAGLLNFINDNFLHAPSADLSREMVKMLSSVMLAQAQEVFTEKQIRDSGKSSIVAKLAAETASLYHNANETLTELVIAGNIDSVWASYCGIKEKYYASIAHYHQACFEVEKGKYGLAVARLTLAQSVIKEALTAAKSQSGQFSRCPCLSNDPGVAMVDAIKSSIELIAEKAAVTKKENDVVYNETPVKESAIPAVLRLASAKPISLHDLYKGQDVSRIIGQDIFHRLVPLSVHESASLYSEEIAKLLRDEQERSDIADTKLSTALDYLGLPKSLHQFKVSDENLARDLANTPANLATASATVARLERNQSVQRQLEHIKELRELITNSLMQATRNLDLEGRQCEAMRAQYLDLWTQQASAQLTAGLREDLKNYSRSLATAEQSDLQLHAEFVAIQAEVVILSKGPTHLDSVFRSIATESDSGTDSSLSLLDLEDSDNFNDVAIKVDQVDDALRKLNLVKKERLQTLQDLKEKARKDDISEVLILNKKTPGIEQRVFQSELEKFKPHRTRISATISRQEQLLDEVKITFTSVLADKSMQTKTRKWDVASARRTSTIESLTIAANSYEGLSSGAAKAVQFYNDLNGLVKNTSSQVSQFIQQRQQEGRQLLERTTRQGPRDDGDSLRRQLDRMSMGDAATRRPQPPPPAPPHTPSYQRPY